MDNINYNNNNNESKYNNYKEDGWGKIKHEDDQLCCRLLQKHLTEYMGYTNVIDVSLNKDWQKADIDLVGTDKNGNTAYIEIKADDYNAIGGFKKIFLETMSNSNTGSLGCVLSSRANIFIWVFLRYNCFAVIDAKALQRYVNNNKDAWGKPKKTGTCKNGQLCYNTEGYVKSLRDLRTAGVNCPICFFDAAACDEIDAQQRKKAEIKREFEARRNPPPQPMPPTSSYIDQIEDVWEVYPATPDNCPFLDPQSA